MFIAAGFLFIVLAGGGFVTLRIWRQQTIPTEDGIKTATAKKPVAEALPTAPSPTTDTKTPDANKSNGPTTPATQSPAAAAPTVPLPAATPVPAEICNITTPPTSLNLDSFYQKYCDINGFAVVSSSVVSDTALKTAAKIIASMTSKRPDVLKKLIANNVRYGIIGQNQPTLGMPEYRDLYDPDFDWNARSRGFGATYYRPLSSSGEENLLCLPGDRYVGESITVHEFSHTFLDMGLEPIDGGFRPRIEAAYNSAIDSGKWSNTYAATNADEYWAEGVQDFFDTNIQSSPANGIHNEIYTRSQLQSYDSNLYNLIAEVFPSTSAKVTCQ